MPSKEGLVEISRDNIFFYLKPPREVVKRLRELGMEFEEHVWWCG